MTAPEGLTSFQVAVAKAFFELPQSDGFLLAGGAALLAQQLTTRPTQDLDFFASPGHGDVPHARDAFESAAHARGWQVSRVRDAAPSADWSCSGRRAWSWISRSTRDRPSRRH